MKRILLFPVYLVVNIASLALLVVGTVLEVFGERLLAAALDMNAGTPQSWWFKATQDREDTKELISALEPTQGAIVSPRQR
jgi:hypothetical protein